MLQQPSVPKVDNAHAGLVQEVALKHKAADVVGHNALKEIPLGKICKYIEAAGGGGLAVAEVMKGDWPKDVVTVTKAAVKGAHKGLSGDAAVSQGGSAMKTVMEQLPSVVMEQVPAVGRVVAKSVTDVVISGIGKCA